MLYYLDISMLIEASILPNKISTLYWLTILLYIYSNFSIISGVYEHHVT